MSVIDRVSLARQNVVVHDALRVSQQMQIFEGRQSTAVKPTVPGAMSIRLKRSYLTQGIVSTLKPEFEDCVRIARSTGLPLKLVQQAALNSADLEWGNTS